MDDHGVGPGTRTVVLVEGASDRSALEALARRRQIDLAGLGVAVVAMGGATNIGRFMDRYGPAGLGLRVAGLCDLAELPYVRAALDRSGLGAELLRVGLEGLGFFTCDRDLEDELLRALGVEQIEAFIESQGELGGFRILQQQPAQRQRSLHQQARRFIGSRSGRKERYAPAIVNRIPLSRVPRPLDELLGYLAEPAS
jgi:Overcoming lysogenization defect protein-like, TOPRIM domain